MSIECMWIRKSHVGSTLEGIEIVTGGPLDRWNHAHRPTRYPRPGFPGGGYRSRSTTVRPNDPSTVYVVG